MNEPSATSPRRWKVTLYEGGFVVDAESEHEARVEALQTVAESLDLFTVEPALPCPDGNPHCDGTGLLHGSWCLNIAESSRG